MNERRWRRLSAAAGIVCVAVLAFGVLGGTGLAGSAAKPVNAAKPAKPAKPQDATGQSRTRPAGSAAKVTICQKGKVTLRISENAVAAHQARHADTLGACAAGTTAANAKGKPGKAKQNASGKDDASEPDDD